jgi:perosamine synthetase
MTEFISVNQPNIDELEKKYLLEAIDTGWISSDGPFVAEFENRFATQMDRKFGVAVSNGTVALEIAFNALNLKPGDEVIVPAVSWSTTYYPLQQYGLKLKFVYINLYTLNADFTTIKDAISRETKAIF